MATIRVREWTKEQIEKIRDAESHSSHDSVIKSLLKDRELAKFAGEAVDPAAATTPDEPRDDIDKPFEDLTVIDELSVPDDSVLFLWCPNCATEVAHLTVDGTMRVSTFEMECQHCLSDLNQHVIVAIEIGYPIEQKLTADDLTADLEACVIDYWDRRLTEYTEGGADADVDIEQLVWQFGEYAREFGWQWPSDVPAISFEPGTTYRNTRTDEYIEVVEPVTDNRNALDSFEIRRYGPDEDPASADTEIMDSSTVVDLVATRSLLVDHQPPGATATTTSDRQEKSDSR
jgi:hypothetical protein